MIEFLKTLLILLAFITLVLILMQSNKEDAGLGALTGQGDSNLFMEKKERGIELYLSRATTISISLIFILSLLINIYK